MLNAPQTQVEYPCRTMANQLVAEASEGRSFAIGAAIRQRETDLIMEALVREYMTVRNAKI